MRVLFFICHSYSGWFTGLISPIFHLLQSLCRRSDPLYVPHSSTHNPCPTAQVIPLQVPGYLGVRHHYSSPIAIHFPSQFISTHPAAGVRLPGRPVVAHRAAQERRCGAVRADDGRRARRADRSAQGAAAGKLCLRATRALLFAAHVVPFWSLGDLGGIAHTLGSAGSPLQPCVCYIAAAWLSPPGPHYTGPAPQAQFEAAMGLALDHHRHDEGLMQAAMNVSGLQAVA